MISLTSPVRTLWHGWPAGVKLGALCLATMALFATRGIGGQLLALGLVVACYGVGGRAFLRAGVGALKPLWPFLAIIALWHVLTGTPAAGLVIALRLISAVAAANLVTMTTTLSQMIAVLHALGRPLRALGIPTRPAELAVAMAVRFTPVLLARGQALVLAWRARSPRRPSWRIIAPLALGAIDEAEQAADALRARGGVVTEGTEEHGT